MSRPKHLNCVMTPEIISRINENQNAYDKNPEEYDRKERQKEEELREEQEREREDFRALLQQEAERGESL